MTLPSILLAQRIEARIVDQHDNPVPGVVLQLLDTAGAVVARALSDEHGELALETRAAGHYRIRTLRIGFRPLLSEPITLAAGRPPVARLIVLEGLPMRLDTIRVAQGRVCRATDSAAVAFRLWDQARTALVAAELSAGDHGVFATTLGYTRMLDPDGRRVRSHDATIHAGYVTQPWRSLPPDSLHRMGFVREERDGSTMYYAPGLDMLGSAEFIEDHCFRFVGLADGGTRSGVAFEPAAGRRGVVDIGGTVWFDPATSELRSLEYQYQNASPDVDPAGAEMQFVHLRNGMWVVSHWMIRVPVSERRIRSASFGDPETRVVEVSVTGGDLVLLRRGLDTLWSRPPLVLSGTVLDSLSDRPVANARIALAGTSLSGITGANGRFAIPAVLPGEYTLEVRTASLDSVNAVHRSSLMFADTNAQVRVRVPSAEIVTRSLCGTSPLANQGIILGEVVFAEDSGSGTAADTGSREVAVSAAWGDPNKAGRSTRWLDTRASESGEFRFCNVPINTLIVIQAMAQGRRGRSTVRVTIPPSARFTHAQLELERVARPAEIATFTGVVVADSSRRPVAGAEVLLPDLGLVAVTNEYGAFRLNEVPAGNQHVVVRHIGHGVLAATIAFPGGQVVNRRLVLDRLTALDPVLVSATEIDRSMASFDDHRHVGLGHFLISEQLRKMEGRTTGAVLSEFAGIAFVRGRAGQQWVVSLRPHSLSSTGATPKIDEADRLSGAATGACYAHVYLDQMLVYSGNDEEPLFDVNSVAPAQIEAIEYYSGPAETPPEFSGLNSTCGILVIWTRRFP